jgi:presenilin-like A22 family membrane protease
MTLAIAGIGARIGLILPVDAVIIILIVLSIYDYIAVYKTKHMVKMFKNLISRNVPLSLIVPTKLEGMKAKVDDASPGKDKKGKRKFMMLGTGDIAFPVIFAVAAARHSLFSGIAVIFGAFFGIIAVYSILINSKKGAIPALPPIAACTIIAFILSIMVEFLAVLF